eukprot:216702_1
MDNINDIEQMLLSMGFTVNYIKRAFKVYEKNYGDQYNIFVITEIIVRLQNKDKLNKHPNVQLNAESNTSGFDIDYFNMKATATAMIISILNEHGKLSKTQLHKEFKKMNNGIHWTDSVQKQLGSLKKFLLSDQRFEVIISNQSGSNFFVTLNNDSESNDSDYYDTTCSSDSNDKIQSNICCVCSESTTQRCSGCKSVYYCSAKCQKQDWKMHKKQCKILKEKYENDVDKYIDIDIDNNNIETIEQCKSESEYNKKYE